MYRPVVVLALLALCFAALPFNALAEEKTRIVFVAGKPSHGPGQHEHRAGSMLLAKCLNENMPNIDAVVVTNGWPEDTAVFDGAAAVVVYSDGGGNHPLNPHLSFFQTLADQGVGLVCLHYGVETTRGECGDAFLGWIGGYFEPHWSVNPHWTANYDELPAHPITRGVSPFEVNDEWYYHMRFVPEMQGVTPILTDLPPDSTLERGDGPHSGNPAVREAIKNGEVQHTAWAYERSGGGRGFGYTGGHFHRNWQHDDVRKLVLNAIVWAAGLDVPEEGVTSLTPDEDGMKANLDKKN